MRSLIPRPLVALTLLAMLPAPAHAWTDTFHEEAAVQAARLMPLSLQQILAQNSGRLREGARAPHAVAGTDRQYLHAGGSYGALDQEILRQTQRCMDLLGSRAPLAVVAYEMGLLSHLVSLAESPLHVAADDPREPEWAADFEGYADRKRERFRIVFHGYLSSDLERDDVGAFATAICDRSRRFYPVLASSYHLEDGRLARSATFDDRHPVFGIASLAWARTIGDTAKLWLYIWIRSGGDAASLPFPLRDAPRVVQGAGQ
jgi:hypothetical protein